MFKLMRSSQEAEIFRLHTELHEKVAELKQVCDILERLIQLTENIRKDLIIEENQRDHAIDKPSP